MREEPKNRLLLLALVGVIVVSGYTLVRHFRARAPAAPASDQAFFSTREDGGDWFVADARNLAPFDHEGKPAWKVHLFTCDGGATRFVGYLERCTAFGRQTEDALRANPRAARDPVLLDDLRLQGYEIKAPNGPWVRRTPDAMLKIMTEARCPNDGAGPLERVEP